MSTTKRHVPLVVTAAIAAVMLSGCSNSVDGTPTSTSSGMIPASTMSSTSTPSRTTTAPVTSTAAAPSHSEITPTGVNQIVQDVVNFWRERGVDLKIRTREVSELTCSGMRYTESKAIYCDKGDIIYYLPLGQMTLDSPNRMLVVQALLAHEVGHAVQDYAGKLQGAEGDRIADGTKIAELSADCFSGIYMATQSPTAAGIEFDTPPRTAAYQYGRGIPAGQEEQCLTHWD
ncbi:hypothetical protein P3F83_07755 [Mycobacteroides immunogenum]|uniref:hypothetical protein n=1 Tax=Mycobacteroides immunogenum TaxID=83262 RepID=UPI0025B77E8B|nr:hypothetical protein [Mycobacteroides immunogenum]WJR35255.1 hypothetical protein P3F83_07755 [Mycobacteroides immunogenum]